MNKVIKHMMCFVLMVTLLIGNMMTCFALSDYAQPVEKEDIIPYTYSSSYVTSSMESLVERTEVLKTSYSSSESLSILRSLESAVEDITSSDYSSNYDIKHDPENYERKAFYKYKYSHTEWIIKNVTSCMLSNSASDAEYMELVEIIYRIAKIEMEHSAKVCDSMNLLSIFMYIDDDFPSSVRDFISFAGLQAGFDAMNYEEGTLPVDKSMKERYEDYLENLRQEEYLRNEIIYANSQTEVIPEPEKIYVEGYDDSYFDNFNSYMEFVGDNYKPEIGMDADDYIKKMEDAKNVAHTTYKVYESKSIYYTFDKTQSNIDWVDTGISMDSETIPFKKFLTILSYIARNEGYYYFEDTDMVMLIADGVNLVVNKQEDITEEEMRLAFDTFPNLGIGIMLYSETENTTSEVLSERVQNGDVNSISVNGERTILTETPIISKNILQLPIEQVAKAIGYDVTINDKEVKLISVDTDANGEIINTNEIVITVDSNSYTVNNQKNSFRTAVTSNNGVIFVEFDKLAQLMNYSYSFNEETNTIEFKTME